MHYTTAVITHGLVEKFPTLRAVLTEWGVTWMPQLLARLNANYDLLRVECPRVKGLLSEALRSRVRMSTQPVDQSKPRKLPQFLEVFDDLQDMLVFSSDCPHRDADEPTDIARFLPRSWRRKIFSENAIELYWWQNDFRATREKVAHAS
jgi:predicted TIM-barrel fold metal-dependent hydrolase